MDWDSPSEEMDCDSPSVSPSEEIGPTSTLSPSNEIDETCDQVGSLIVEAAEKLMEYNSYNGGTINGELIAKIAHLAYNFDDWTFE
jgi:hypothetical protein